MVVFDWNGTIMSDLRRAVGATNAVLARRGLGPLSPQEFRARFALPLDRWLVGLGVAAPDAPAAEREWNAALATEPAAPRPEAATVLGDLVARGALTGVVSAAGAEAVHADVAGAGLAHLLGEVATGVRDKAAHLRVLRPRRARAVYVGDTTYDMASARRAGFTAVGVTGGYSTGRALRAAGADAVVDSLEDLLTVCG
ncbi:hypothetical protein BJF78_26975 [Pseudonocardia sp. CNS-139]|nr:hypothetical protein BJF78_26975 [Pseudonocardia sp. CNS-139]